MSPRYDTTVKLNLHLTSETRATSFSRLLLLRLFKRLPRIDTDETQHRQQTATEITKSKHTSLAASNQRLTNAPSRRLRFDCHQHTS